MGINKQIYYKSQKILGELYRGVDEEKIWVHDVQRPVAASGPSPWEQLNTHVRAALKEEGYTVSDVDYTHRIDDAWKLRELYDPPPLHLNILKRLTGVEIGIKRKSPIPCGSFQPVLALPSVKWKLFAGQF